MQLGGFTAFHGSVYLIVTDSNLRSGDARPADALRKLSSCLRKAHLARLTRILVFIVLLPGSHAEAVLKKDSISISLLTEGKRSTR